MKRMTEVLRDKNACIQSSFSKSEIKKNEELRRNLSTRFSDLYELYKNNKISKVEFSKKDNETIQSIYSTKEAMDFYEKLLRHCQKESKEHVEMMKLISERSCKIFGDKVQCKKLEIAKKMGDPMSTPSKYRDFEVHMKSGHAESAVRAGEQQSGVLRRRRRAT